MVENIEKGKRYVSDDYWGGQFIYVQQTSGDYADRSRFIFYNPDKISTGAFI